MKTEVYLYSLAALIIYCIVIVVLPNFGLYVAFRGYIFPAIISIFLTILNFNSIENILDYFIKLLIFIIISYTLRWLIFFVFNVFFDVDIRCLKTD